MNFKHAEILIDHLRKGMRLPVEAELRLSREQAGNVAAVVESLVDEVERLTNKCRNQKLELRRVNQAHLQKNARINNMQGANDVLDDQLGEVQRENKILLDTIRAFMVGEIEVVKPFTPVPMPAQSAPDLMSMVRDISPLNPGKPTV